MQQQFVATIRANSKRLESLLTDMSDMSKIRGGTLKINPKMDMFKNIAMMIEKQMSPTVEELGRKLEFDIPQGLPLLNVDGEMLTKAVGKLVENSLRYMQPEAGPVKVSARGEGNKLHIQVQDSGIGIKPEDMAKLGTPFFRADDELVLNYRGSGLGIPIAYGIIDLLGGTVAVTSQPGQGTTFTVTITGMS
jgi:cell cycle sensor histidine kinase DivJ